MCTVSWLHDDDGFHLLCNRDEQKTRLPGAAPQIRTLDGVAVVAPSDGQFGGTWVCVNEFGVAMSLLNGPLSGSPSCGAPGTARPAGMHRSRGLFLLSLASADSFDDAMDRFWNASLEPYSAFTVVVLEPEHPAGILEWNRTEKVVLPYGQPYMPLASSSFDPAGVPAARTKQFQALASHGTPSLAEMLSFHRSHQGEPGAYSPCMHRNDAQTVSFSWITVNDSQVAFRHTPVCPCWQHPADLTILPRT